MGRVAVKAERISSMLANRHQSADEVASRLTLSVDLLRLVDEDAEVEYADLTALARHFKRTWPYLLIAEPEVFPSAGQDHRSVRNRLRPLAPELFDQVQAVVEMLASAAELFPETRYEIPTVRIVGDTSPDAAGAAIRGFLGITSDQQCAAKSDYAALRIWVDALQERGVYVSQRSLPDETIRAFSRVAGAQAVVVVKTSETPYARIFSLVHEYAHVILRSTGVCDLSEHSKIERHCNAVAAATLMPTSLVTAVLNGRRFGLSAEADDALIHNLSHEIRVSQEALLIRLRELGVLTEALYDELEVRRSARRPVAKKKRGRFYESRINRVGRRYAHNVFGALDGGIIDREDAGSLLEVGEHLVNTYREKLAKTSGRSR